MNKILIIEDDRIMRENMAEILELSGYDVAVAENGKTGIKSVKAMKPDLIVCDIKMPVLDGYGVLHILSKDADTADIPFIFVTAKTERGERRKGMEMGADDYLTKPFEDTELLKAIEIRLKKHEAMLKQKSNLLNDEVNFAEDADWRAGLNESSEKSLTHEYQQKELVFKTGDYPRFVFFIEEGSVKTYGINIDGKELITNIYNTGDLFGYQPVFEKRAYRESAEALKLSSILKIHKNDFLTLIRNNKKVAHKLIKTISENLSVKEEELVHMAYDSVRKRLANKLIELITPESNGAITISRTDLAALVGTSPETLVRTLTEFRKLQLIEADSQKISLIDRDKLNKLARAW
jgi:DNA-binding response OmpR family regulator/predicted transcriptional regulator